MLGLKIFVQIQTCHFARLLPPCWTGIFLIPLSISHSSTAHCPFPTHGSVYSWFCVTSPICLRGLALQKKATMEKQSSIDEDDGEGWGRRVFGRAWFDNEWGGGGPLAQEDFFPWTNSTGQSTGHMYQEVQTSKTQLNTYTQGILIWQIIAIAIRTFLTFYLWIENHGDCGTELTDFGGFVAKLVYVLSVISMFFLPCWCSSVKYSVFCCFRLVVTSCLVSNVWVGKRRIIIIIAIIVILVIHDNFGIGITAKSGWALNAIE